MTDRDASRLARPPARRFRSAWVELAGGAIVAAIIVAFFTVVLTSMHW
jgi:hypothetical protein